MVYLKERSNLHLERKVWHLTTVFFMYCVYRLAPEKVSLGLLSIGWLLSVSLDLARNSNEFVNKWVLKIFGPLMRDSEERDWAGTTHLTTGVMIVAWIFDREVVSLTLLFLAFVDPIASFFGILFGKIKLIGQKSLAGFVAAFVACFIASLFFMNFGISKSVPVITISFLCAIIGAFSELLPIGKLDDNLTLPVLSASGVSCIFYLFSVY